VLSCANRWPSTPSSNNSPVILNEALFSGAEGPALAFRRFART